MPQGLYVPFSCALPRDPKMRAAGPLARPELTYYIRVAMEGPCAPAATFQYMCGCCWRELADRQEVARRLIEDGQI